MKTYFLFFITVFLILVLAVSLNAEGEENPSDAVVYSLGYGTPTNTQAVPEFSLPAMLALIAIVLAVLVFRRIRNS